MKEQECTDFIAAIPTTTDETVALDGKVGEYAAIARKKGDTWYVGAMTNWTPRELTLDFSFLGEGSYQAVIFKDGKCISVAKGTASPDVMMTIDQFSRFILGCSDVDGMAYAPNGRCCAPQGREESLRQKFYKKPCFISEYF